VYDFLVIKTGQIKSLYIQTTPQLRRASRRFIVFIEIVGPPGFEPGTYAL